jgi:AraC-like DNA-binding protein
LESWKNQFQNGDEFAFVFIEGGVAKYVVSAAAQRLVAGNILIFRGHSDGKLWADDNSECAFAYFSIRFEQLFPIFSSDEMSLLHEVMVKFKRAKVYAPNTPLTAECQRLLASAQVLQSLDQRSRLLCVVAAILSDEFKDAHIRQSGTDWAEDRMIQAFEKLSSEELLTLPVEELASKFNCSRRHLNRLFHERFGCSVIALKMELRLMKAVSLLMDPQAKIIHVAEQSGFNHLGLFNTCFKRRYGASPGQWRKAMLSSGKPQLAKPGPKQTCLMGLRCPWGAGGGMNPAPAVAGNGSALAPKSAAHFPATIKG